MINKEKIITLIGEVRKALGELSKYISLDDSIILDSSEKLGNIKYQFIIAIEACIDICNHIAVKTYSRAPDSYSECFELLGQKKILNIDLSKEMSRFAKFRNLLVHLYWKVDDRMVVDILKNDLHSINGFIEEIIVFVKF